MSLKSITYSKENVNISEIKLDIPYEVVVIIADVERSDIRG